MEALVESPPILREARLAKHEMFAFFGPVAASSLAAAKLESAGGTVSALHSLPPSILGIGYGAKQTSGASVDDELAVRVYVRAKLPRTRLSRAEMVPTSVNGVATDVVSVGDITAFARPTRCGVSCGHHAITAGTLGCLVRANGGDGRHYILSNNHVLANANSAVVNDDVLEPGPLDGGTTPIARLADFEPIDFAGSNLIDAAIAEVIDLADVLPEITIIGAVRPPTKHAAIYQSVRKHGRTTLHTVGVVMDVAADIKVRYGTHVAAFEDQIAIEGVGGSFSQGGDSGSLIVDAVSRSPVGLLFAGGGATTFANWIDPVLERFNAEIV
jgi:hypothetical protein